MDATPTRERILAAARYLFWERGYSATGLTDIFARAKAQSGSFYHFFTSKEDVLNQVLDSYVSALYPALITPATNGVIDPIDRVFAILERYRQNLLTTDCTYGCPIGRLALEIDPRISAKELIAKNFAGWSGAVERFLREAADRFPPGTDFAALAQFVLVVMEGGVMLARANHDIAPFDAAVEQLRTYVDLLQTRRGGGRSRATRSVSADTFALSDR